MVKRYMPLQIIFSFEKLDGPTPTRNYEYAHFLDRRLEYIIN